MAHFFPLTQYILVCTDVLLVNIMVIVNVLIVNSMGHDNQVPWCNIDFSIDNTGEFPFVKIPDFKKYPFSVWSLFHTVSLLVFVILYHNIPVCNKQVEGDKMPKWKEIQVKKPQLTLKEGDDLRARIFNIETGYFHQPRDVNHSGKRFI